MAVYLIHFSKPLAHARHYLGFADTPESIPSRLERHRSGHGAKLTKAATAAGIEFEITRIWVDGTRDFERKLKNQKQGPKLCPLCIAEKKK